MNNFVNTATVYNNVWNKPQLKWLRHEINQVKLGTRQPHKFNDDYSNTGQPTKSFPLHPETALESKIEFIRLGAPLDKTRWTEQKTKVKQTGSMSAIRQAVINKIWQCQPNLQGINPQSMYLQQVKNPLPLHRLGSFHGDSTTVAFLMPINTKEEHDKTLIFSETLPFKNYTDSADDDNNLNITDFSDLEKKIRKSRVTKEGDNSFKYNLRHTAIVENNVIFHNPLDNLNIDKTYDNVPGTMLEFSNDRLLANTFFKSGKTKDYILSIFYHRQLTDKI
jgi:hypothetical protein